MMIELADGKIVNVRFASILKCYLLTWLFVNAMLGLLFLIFVLFINLILAL